METMILREKLRYTVAKLVLRGDECILDMGCGDGRIAADPAKHVPKARNMTGNTASPYHSHASTG